MDCSLCCETFTEEGPHVPRTLDCGHTFCTLCIQKLDTHATLRQGPRCPDCRTGIRFNRRNPTSLPKNYKLLELIREQRGNQSGGTKTEEQDRRSGGSSAIPAPDQHPHPPVMYMPSFYHPSPPMTMIPAMEGWLSHPWQLPPEPAHFRSMNEEFSRMRFVSSSSEMTESAVEETSAVASNAVDNGRAVAGPNGTLVCKFFQDGLCRYGPNCWFSHPVINENKSLCRHWLKGQCRRGLNCNYRHGTLQCHRPRPSRRTTRDPNAAGPSGEGSSSHRVPSTVVLVTSSQARVARPIPPRFSPSSESETFFDDFGTSYL